MSNIINRIGQALGHHITRLRNIDAVRRIGIHHSATATGTTAIFENFWRNLPLMGAPNAIGGYHETILLNGDVEVNYNPTQIIHGISGQNADTYHICVVGNSVFTAAQERALSERLRFNMSRLNIPAERVLGHREFPGHSTNSCPGRNMNTLRNQLREPGSAPPPNMHTVTRATGGFFTAADARAGRNQRTVVEAGIYHVFNRSQGMINVTTRQGTPGSWIDPAEPAPQPDNTIRVGSRIRINQNAQRWATGEVIPSWVRGQTYTVSQMRNNNNELLLASVMSWIRRSDVTLV